ncbi:hypothetical protein KOM00_20290 [Geomonas sp. Red69]|uniref:hypothetical protein n=1 Tax=Geomonas diazotrophica TaxID=2843197 RepID=UPI001C10F386|nr:hypothetical protein [Geomonas diazotrophica]MBU5639065.1 hypothetical protein [Geomonas diazotrophica]
MPTQADKIGPLLDREIVKELVNHLVHGYDKVVVVDSVLLRSFSMAVELGEGAATGGGAREARKTVRKVKNRGGAERSKKPPNLVRHHATAVRNGLSTNPTTEAVILRRISTG